MSMLGRFPNFPHGCYWWFLGYSLVGVGWVGGRLRAGVDERNQSIRWVGIFRIGLKE